jgi:quinol monooxygenase YgiN
VTPAVSFCYSEEQKFGALGHSSALIKPFGFDQPGNATNRPSHAAGKSFAGSNQFGHYPWTLSHNRPENDMSRFIVALIGATLFLTCASTAQKLAAQESASSEHPLITDVKTQLGRRKPTLPFIMVIDLQCKQGKREQFVTAMKEAIKETRKEKGNMRYQLIADLADKNHFQMHEQWRNMDAFLIHMKAPYLATLESKLGDLLEGDLKLKVMAPVPVKRD